VLSDTAELRQNGDKRKWPKMLIFYDGVNLFLRAFKKNLYQKISGKEEKFLSQFG
jgi:hypothetical protein